MKSIAAAILLSLGAQEKMDNPQYTHWKSCKPGSWVKHKMVMDAGGRAVETELTSTLVEVSADKVVLDSKMVMDMDGRKMEMPAPRKEVPAMIEKKEGQAPPSEKEEEVAVNGKTYKCRTWEWTSLERGQPVKAKGWLCPEIPGGLVKSEFGSPQMPKPMTMTLIGFEKK